MLRHHSSCPYSLAVGFLLGVTFAGCSATGTSPLTGSSRHMSDATGQRLPGTDLATVRPIAEQAFAHHFRLDPHASTGTLLVSYPLEATDRVRTARLQDVLGGLQTRHRYICELYLIQKGSDIETRCRVGTYRLDTTEKAAFPSPTGDDRPTQTPIERAGATGADFREEWTYVGRARDIEREILSMIRKRLQPSE